MTSRSSSSPSERSTSERSARTATHGEADCRKQIYQLLHTCREDTLQMLDRLDAQILGQQAHPEFSPIGWHVGHIAYTEALWILEHLAQQSRPFPEYSRLFAADGLPKSERGNLPAIAELQIYLSTVRSQVLEYLETAPIRSEERLWRWLVQHECQHGETIAIVEALHQVANGQFPIAQSISPSSSHQFSDFIEMVLVPGGAFECGSDRMDAIDNERPAHLLQVDAFWIDRTPVTQRQFQQFMDAEGYHDARWWSTEGWEWLQTQAIASPSSSSISQPLYWVDQETHLDHPICGVSWYEADAYARFVGKRLPTEGEWEKAARWNHKTYQTQPYPWGADPISGQRGNYGFGLGQTTPVTQYPAGASAIGCLDLLGNVWEWTNTWFDGYFGFEAYPYRGYSEAYFDRQHRVLRGGSFATRSPALRSSFRNWYHPHQRQMFAGFRCARDVEY